MKVSEKLTLTHILLVIAFLFGFTSCGDSSDITVYTTPKEEVIPSPANESDASVLEKYASKTSIGDLPAHLVQAENDGKSIRVFLLKLDGKTWFFKLIGNTKLAIREQKNFDKFVRSIDVKTEQPQDKWFIPEGWEPGKKSSMRIGSFSVTDDDDSSLDISVTSFPGDLGGLLPNVKRWLGQIDLDLGEGSK